MINSVGPLVVTLFVPTGAIYLVRLLRARDWDCRVLNGSHLLMSALMIMMPLGWSVVVPAAAQLLIFTAAALWYAYQLLFRPDAVPELVGGHHSGRPRLLYHVGMMLSMVWMAVIMAPLPSTGDQAAPETMPGMSMPGMSTAGVTNSPLEVPALHGWAGPISIMIGVAFCAATIWYLARFILIGGTTGRVNVRKLADNGAAALMAAGMALSNLVVIR